MVEPAFACRLYRRHNEPAVLDREFDLIRNFASGEQRRGNQYTAGITDFAQVCFHRDNAYVITMYALYGDGGSNVKNGSLTRAERKLLCNSIQPGTPIGYSSGDVTHFGAGFGKAFGDVMIYSLPLLTDALRIWN